MNQQQALISVSDKTGIIEFAKALVQLNISILATGGTATLLKDNHIPLQDISDYIGFPEIMQGRVKTLHPKIHGGILARRGIDDEVLEEHHILPIDFVIVNLYPFAKTIANPACCFADAVEQIDIGGPTMLRAAAKNCDYVNVIVDPNDYPMLIETLKKQGKTDNYQRRCLAAKVFAHTAHYDGAIAAYFANQIETDPTAKMPARQHLNLTKLNDLRYGENPQQRAAVYAVCDDTKFSLANDLILQGKPLSYNNLLDADAAYHCVNALNLKQPACTIVKHATPCGVAAADTLEQAYQHAYATDPTSAFGGIIAFNTEVDEKTAATLLNQQFVECIVAPAFSAAAITLFKSKPNLRVLQRANPLDQTQYREELRSINGAILLQQCDDTPSSAEALHVVSQAKPTEKQIHDLLFAWNVVRFAKSNAIVYAKDQQTLGIGSGQTSRVFSAKIAVLKAQEANLSLQDSVMASDAFFPFADGLQVAIDAGISAVIQPGGSKRDADVIAAADAAGIVMVMTGIRHFKH